MPQDSFEAECERLSGIVDGALCERLRWERNEGPMLTRLVALARAALESRPEFELAEEGATRDLKRFVLKIHGNRVFSITLSIAGGRAQVEASPIERSRYSLAPGGMVTADYDSVDEAWMSGALERQFGRVGGAPRA